MTGILGDGFGIGDWDFDDWGLGFGWLGSWYYALFGWGGAYSCGYYGNWGWGC